MASHKSLFDVVLEVPGAEIEFDLRSIGEVGWASFWLNPRRLRGSDFLMRWSQGQWSEERFVQAVNHTGAYFALPYGPSSVAPDGDVRAFELYFERLEAAGHAEMKRPDLLLFRVADTKDVDLLVEELRGLIELPFTPETDTLMQELLQRAILAIECENSFVEGGFDARLWNTAKTHEAARGTSRITKECCSTHHHHQAGRPREIA